jgi:RHS repeat-associated protein
MHTDFHKVNPDMMRHPLIYFFLLFCILTGHVQTAVAQTGSQNFVLSRTYKQTGADANDISKVNIQVQYLDGLGRPSQTVSVGQSTAGTDVIVPMEYDALGRQPKAFLPYAGGGSGTFQGGAVGDQAGFYSGNAPQLEGSDLGRPYQETVFEASPSSRPLSSRAPGNKSASGSITHTANDGAEVKRYVYNGTVTESGTFGAGRLYKTQTTDENGKLNTEYTDTKGRLICKKAGSEALTTYYVYDDYGLLRAVLQPQYQDNASTADFAFLYDYDERGRVISKKVPGAGRVDLVYDNFDRLAMSQDANQLARGVWGFTKYDALNRKALTGEVGSGASRAALQASFNASQAHHEDRSGTSTGYTLGNTLPGAAAGDVLTVAYYDDYSFPGNQAYAGTLGAATTTTAVKGQQTGSAVRMLNAGATLLAATTFYDAEYRPVQSIRQLSDIGSLTTERISTKYKYDLAPVAEQEKTDHEASGAVTNSHLKTFTYDHADRLLSVREKLTVGAVIKEATTLAQRYNLLGQLKSKWLHSDDAVKFRRRTDYLNNIRGWITDGKTVYKQSEGSADFSFFKYGLAYANGGTYTNGNISQMLLGGKDETTLTKGLAFSYDGVNRLSGSTGLSGYADLENGITYDKNGNLKTLNRSGSAVDNLGYAYSGNRLSSINDASGNNTGVKAGSSSYGYDGNGNMTSDGSRGAVLTYNYLNLPKTVAVGGKTLTYDYDATGTKYKYVADTLTVKYAGGFEYNAANAFTRLGLSEGQAVLKNNVIAFQYYVKDHLGNVRVVFDEKGAILQKNDYYPFGLAIDRNTPVQTPAARNEVNRYSFLGKEMQVATGYMDLQARFYDPTTGRFMQVDPATELQESQSVYQYGWNNPILRSDPNGTYPDGPGDDPFLIARLVTTAFFDTKHAIINTAARAFNSDIRAGYKVDGDGNQTFETQISRQQQDRSVSGQLREAVNTFADVASVATAGSNPLNPGNLLSKTSGSQTIKAVKEAATEVITAVHGNSKASDKLTTLYKLETTEGQYLKTGVTSKVVPEKRYSNKFMEDKRMFGIDKGTRFDMLQEERKIVETNPGPLNREPWAGKRRDEQ